MYSTIENVVESAKLAWKHKLLWVVALLAAGVYSTSFNLSDIAGGNDKNDGTDSFEENSYRQSTTVESTNQLDDSAEQESVYTEVDSVLGMFEEKVLGAAVQEPLGENPPMPLTFAGLPGSIFVIIAMVIALLPAIFLMIFFNSTIFLLVNSWAKGAFFSNTLRACKGEDYGFKTLGDDGRKYWKRYLKLSLYFLGIRILTILPFFILGLLFALFYEKSTTIVSVIAAIAFVIAFVWFFIFNISLYFVEQYSYRLIATKEMDTKSTYRAGWTYYKTRPGKSIKLFLILSLIPPLCLFIMGVIASPVLLLMWVTRPSYDVGAMVVYPVVLATIFSVLSALLMPYVLTLGSFSWTKLFLFIHNSFEPGPDMATQMLDSVYKPEGESK